jgi:hypothetical protein
MSTLICDQCGRAFEKEAHYEVHPCPAEIGENKARSIRSMFSPGQFRLDEYADGTHPTKIDGQRGEQR